MIRGRDGFEPLPPIAATPATGNLQRQRLQAHLSRARWWTVTTGVVGTALFTVLAVQHTAAVMNASTQITSGTQATPLAPNAPSQSLFQGQGSGANGGGFLAPAPSLGSSVRTSTS